MSRPRGYPPLGAKHPFVPGKFEADIIGNIFEADDDYRHARDHRTIADDEWRTKDGRTSKLAEISDSHLTYALLLFFEKKPGGIAAQKLRREFNRRVVKENRLPADLVINSENRKRVWNIVRAKAIRAGGEGLPLGGVKQYLLSSRQGAGDWDRPTLVNSVKNAAVCISHVPATELAGRDDTLPVSAAAICAMSALEALALLEHVRKEVTEFLDNLPEQAKVLVDAMLEEDSRAVGDKFDF